MWVREGREGGRREVEREGGGGSEEEWRVHTS